MMKYAAGEIWDGDAGRKQLRQLFDTRLCANAQGVRPYFLCLNTNYN